MDKISREKKEELSKFAEWLADQHYTYNGFGHWKKTRTFSGVKVLSTTHQVIEEYYRNGKPHERTNSIKG